jgi:hypothetical protein
MRECADTQVPNNSALVEDFLQITMRRFAEH